jgi:adenylate cyclase
MVRDNESDKLAVILHADVAGSTRMVQMDEHLAHDRIQDTFRRFANTIAKYSGRVLESRGDAILAEFERPSDAVTSSLAFQANHCDYLSTLDDDLKPEVRVGIAMGEVVIADNTITGAGVVLAQRVEQMANPGGLCITAAIHEALSRRYPFEFDDLGEQNLKGFDHHVRVFSVSLSSGSAVPSPDETRPSSNLQSSRRVIWTVTALALLIVAGSILWVKPWQPREEPASLDSMMLPLPDKPSIAVLPFTNMSSDTEQEYFADGMTEDLITDISKISGLKVIARHSTFSYKGQNPDVRKVGSELGATHVIEGSVRKAGNTVRITIQLIDASDGKHIWAERYDRKLRDVFAIQDEVIGEIIAALSLRLTPEEEIRVAKHDTENMEAYDLFMRGRQQEAFFTKESFKEAQKYYEQAVALDSNYAEAWARLAQIHALNGQFGWEEDFLAANQRALSLIEKSLDLKPDSSFIRYGYSRILARESIGQHDRAIEEAQKAIEIDPNFADAYAWLGQLYILTGQAQNTPSLITVAMRINPNFPFWYDFTYGYAHYFMGEFDKAVEYIELAVDRNPNVYFTRLAFAASLAMAGNQDDAEWQIDELFGMGFNKSRDELIEEHPIRDLAYRKLYDQGLEKAGLP